MNYLVTIILCNLILFLIYNIHESIQKIHKQNVKQANQASKQINKAVNKAVNSVVSTVQPVVGGNKGHPNNNQPLPSTSNGKPTTFQ